MSRTVVSKTGDFKCTFGKSKNGTHSVTSWMVGDGKNYPDIPTFCQKGFATFEEASAYAMKELAESEDRSNEDALPW